MTDKILLIALLGINPVRNGMSIFDQEPEDWKEFQDLVAQLFVEIDCEVKVEERIKLVRGEKAIDVWVRDPHTTPPSIYLCECKHWNKPIPQEVIHSFRTVLSDYGANRGFLISKVGFQAGAKEAVKNTNLDLVTFTELQSIFFPRWRVAMGKRFMPYADRLFPYWDYPGKRPKIEWNKHHVERQNLLYKAYYPLVHLGPSFENEGSVWELPMTLPAIDLNGLRNGNVILCTYRQVYDFIDYNKDIALRHFQVLFGEIDA